MYYLESTKTDPSWNLALEQYVFDVLGPRDDCFMLWQNDNTIVVGKHQNTAEEINADFVRTHGVRVVRRLSGGGAVYHDKGNLNFTFIVDRADAPGLNFKIFVRPVVEALARSGVGHLLLVDFDKVDNVYILHDIYTTQYAKAIQKSLSEQLEKEGR